MEKAVIYARFSSYGQREESIEGQIAACKRYAEENDLIILNEYIDRAASATTDHREAFQQMISDATKGEFDTVLVYQLDRFARNRYDAALYRKKLKDCGVRLVSVTEPIADDPSGTFLEALLEAQAEFYSSDLSRKVKRGQAVNAQKCLYNGAIVPLGFRIDEEKHYQIDEETAPIVERVFDMFLKNIPMKKIAEELNEAGFRGFRGAKFNAQSVRKILGNPRYTGKYIFGETEIPNGIPAIIDEATFEAVQAKLGQRRHMRRGSEGFLLSGKIMCGECGGNVVGVSGTSKTGAKKHYYYFCKSANAKKGCSAKRVKRDTVEDIVIEACRSMLTDEAIARIAREVAAINEKEATSPYLKQLRKELQQAEAAIENLLQALELGQQADLLLARIAEQRETKENLERQIAKEEFAYHALTEPEIAFFLSGLKGGNVNDEKYRKVLVSTFVNKVFLYPDHLVIYLNAGSKTIEIKKDFAFEDKEPQNKAGSNKSLVAEE